MKASEVRAWAEAQQKKHWGDYDPDPSTVPDRVATHCDVCLDAWPCDAYRAAWMVLGVLEIHAPCCTGRKEHDAHVFESCDHWEPRWCEYDRNDWPCPTIQAMCEEMGE